MPPDRCPVFDIAASQFQLAQFRAPTEFAFDSALHLGFEQQFPLPARFVREANPCEMEDLVNQDPLEITLVLQDLAVQINDAMGDRRRSPMGTKRSTNRYTDWGTTDRGKHGRQS